MGATDTTTTRQRDTSFELDLVVCFSLNSRAVLCLEALIRPQRDGEMIALVKYSPHYQHHLTGYRTVFMSKDAGTAMTL